MTDTGSLVTFTTPAITQSYFDYTGIAAPSAPGAGNGRLFYGSSDTGFRYLDSSSNAWTLAVDETTISKSSGYIVTADDFLKRRTILCDTSGGAFSLTLPNPSGLVGQITIKDVNGSFSTNNLTILRHGSEKIENVAASRILATDFENQTVRTNQTDWWLF